MACEFSKRGYPGTLSRLWQGGGALPRRASWKRFASEDLCLDQMRKKPESKTLNSRIDPVRNPKKRKWGKWSLWTFIIVNVLGAVVIIPLFLAVMPLIRIWWDTRSQENFERHAQTETPIRVTDFTESAGNTLVPQREVTPKIEQSLSSLTNDLDVVSDLDESELAKIVALQFGEKAERSTDPGTFDRESSVFHSIKKSMVTLDGKQLHCYEVDLVDQNGNHSTHVDCFEEPDLDYERSMATLELVNSNTQLKKIYEAFSSFLGEQSSNPTNATEESTDENNPSFRIEDLPEEERPKNN